MPSLTVIPGYGNEAAANLQWAGAMKMRALAIAACGILLTLPVAFAQEIQWQPQVTSDGDYGFVARSDGKEIVRFGCLAADAELFVLVRGLPSARSGNVTFGQVAIPVYGPQGQMSTKVAIDLPTLEAISGATEVKVTGGNEELVLIAPPSDKVSELVAACNKALEGSG